MLRNMIKTFVDDETGAVTVDMVVVLGGSMLMATTIVQDVSTGALDLSERVNVRLFEIGDEWLPDGTGNIPAYVEEQETASADPVTTDPGSGTDTSGDTSTPSGGNPGNDKNVGNAGENPNGSGDWGGGSNGRSDSGSNGNSDNDDHSDNDDDDNDKDDKHRGRGKGRGHD